MSKENIKVEYVSPSVLKIPEYYVRKHSEEIAAQLKESLTKLGCLNPLLCNSAPGRENIIIGGVFKNEMMKELGFEKVPVVYVNIPDLEKEREASIRLNKAVGEFDFDLLSEHFDEVFLQELGFSSEELDNIFGEEDAVEQFDLEKELEKLNIKKIEIQKGDVYDLDGSKLMCGDSTIEADMLKLCGNEKVDMTMTDPPYILDYLHGKSRNGESTTGFGAKKNRRYLETESIPDNFTELWMGNVAKVQAPHFSIIVYENWKNIRVIWGELEKHWKVRNMLVWHLPNRNQGYAGKYKFFSKHDIAMVGTSENHTGLDLEPEGDELLENEYQTALFAIQGKPQWESYGKGNKYCPTDFIEYVASDEKSSGQGIIFGTKPVEILIPYIKVLTRRNQLVLEPFGGSGSTLVACTKLKRRCFLMEKSPVYAEVIKNRWEKLTGHKAKKIQ